ncbi:hypothetical protein H0H87_002944 [Tephrocybe sp. NHM501043]|nr:hypothetical protein H0H87_002944 [Tephrocybe sp. NHM501043]
MEARDVHERSHGLAENLREKLSLLYALQPAMDQRDFQPSDRRDQTFELLGDYSPSHDLVIPLPSDLIFLQTLCTSINEIAAQLATAQTDVVTTLTTLAHAISDCARPASSSGSGFRPHSAVSIKHWKMSNTTKIKVPYVSVLSRSSMLTWSTMIKQSDLYSWREIFQVYVEAEVFESVDEIHREERSVEESERRLKLFADRVSSRGFSRKSKAKSSNAALDKFLEINMYIVNIKKVRSKIFILPENQSQ